MASFSTLVHSAIKWYKSSTRSQYMHFGQPLFFDLGNGGNACTITVTFNQAKTAETQYHVAESDLKQELINITSKWYLLGSYYTYAWLGRLMHSSNEDTSNVSER